MDSTFHEIQANIIKRLIHSDRRKSIGSDLVTSSNQNRDLSRLRMKNEILFKNLQGHLTSLELEQRQRHGEMLRSVKALTSFPVASKTGELGKRTNMKANEKLSALAKHSHVTKNDISISEERLGKWRENFRERSVTSSTRGQTGGLRRKLSGQNMPEVPSLLKVDKQTGDILEEDCDKLLEKTSERPLRFSKVFPKGFSLRSTAHQETSIKTLSHFESPEVSDTENDEYL